MPPEKTLCQTLSPRVSHIQLSSGPDPEWRSGGGSVGRLFSQLVGCSIGWLVGWLVGRSVSLSVGQSVSLSVDWLVGRAVCRSVGGYSIWI